MKKLIILFCLINCLAFAFASENNDNNERDDLYEYNDVVLYMKGPSSPYEIGDYIVFTSPKNSRQRGIAFDFENYSKIHKFQIHKITDYDGEVTDSWMFYVLKKPSKITSLKYRIIVDGLWTTDDSNESIVYEDASGIPFSYLEIQNVDPIITETEKNGFTKFVCFAESGKKIRLGGTFTNWDSWIYEMKEVDYGKYEISLPLPKGTYYYNYYEGMHSFLDETNPSKGYTADGKKASRIVVN